MYTHVVIIRTHDFVIADPKILIDIWLKCANRKNITITQNYTDISIIF